MSDRIRRYSPDAPSPEAIVLSVFFAILAIVYARWQEGRFDRWEAQCPGKMSVAPFEPVSFTAGTNTYNVYHHGISIGPDDVTISILDSKTNDEIFGGTVQVEHDQITTISGLSFIARATSDQSMTGDLAELTEDENNCIIVTVSE